MFSIPKEVCEAVKDYYKQYGNVILGQTKLDEEGKVSSSGKDGLSVIFTKLRPGIKKHIFENDKYFSVGGKSSPINFNFLDVEGKSYPIRVIFMGQLEARPAYPRE